MVQSAALTDSTPFAKQAQQLQRGIRTHLLQRGLFRPGFLNLPGAAKAHHLGSELEGDFAGAETIEDHGEEKRRA